MDHSNCHRCGEKTVGRFCASCGSRVVPEGKRDLVREFFYIFTDFEKRFIHTLKMMLVSPRTVIFEYIKEGERAKYFPPVRLLMITLVVSYFWFQLTQHIFSDKASMYESLKESIQYGANLKAGKKNLVFSEENYSLFFNEFMALMNLFYKSLNALGILIAAPITLLFYKKFRFTFVEHLILNTFIISTQSFVIMAVCSAILMLPVNYFTFGYLGYIPMFFYSTYVYWALGKAEYKRPLMRAIIVTLLLLLLYSMANALFGMGAFVHIKNQVPDVYVPVNQ